MILKEERIFKEERDWANSPIKELRDYAEEFLPIPNLQCDVPQKWAGCDKEGQPFQTSWNEQTGEWTFSISYNIYGMGNGVWEFNDVMKKYIEKIIIDEGWSELE